MTLNISAALYNSQYWFTSLWACSINYTQSPPHLSIQIRWVTTNIQICYSCLSMFDQHDSEYKMTREHSKTSYLRELSYISWHKLYNLSLLCLANQDKLLLISHPIFIQIWPTFNQFVFGAMTTKSVSERSGKWWVIREKGLGNVWKVTDKSMHAVPVVQLYITHYIYRRN